jgi:Ser/Thr protein kinase RdoA (MazF antagonist)
MIKYLGKRKPANISLTPKKIDWMLCDNYESSFFNNKLSIDGKIYKDKKNQLYSGFYLIKKNNEKKYFIKIIDYEDLDQYNKSEEISDWLRINKLNTPILLKKNNFIVKNNKNKVFLIYKYYHSRFPKNTISDCKKLGKEIGKLHRVLKTSPNEKFIKLRSIEKNEKLQIYLKNLKRDLKKRDDIPKDAKTILKNHNLLNFKLDNTFQVLHGDLNKGNILFINQGKDILFIDFEETINSWGPLKIEIAFFIERFCLTTDKKKAIKLINQFLKNYKIYFPNFDLDEEQLFEILRHINLRTIILLCEISELNLWEIPQEEWNKFINLFNLASKNYFF